ncbi:hypothetical protein GGI23_007591, partial [Coemansia sp. RSA 2559]
MAAGRDLRGILFLLVAFVGLMIVWRDLRYDFTFSNDMRQAELARRKEVVTSTTTSVAVQTQTEVVTEVVQVQQEKATSERASAAFVILTRNKDLKGLRETLAQLEDRFN